MKNKLCSEENKTLLRLPAKAKLYHCIPGRYWRSSPEERLFLFSVTIMALLHGCVCNRVLKREESWYHFLGCLFLNHTCWNCVRFTLYCPIKPLLIRLAYRDVIIIIINYLIFSLSSKMVGFQNGFAATNFCKYKTLKKSVSLFLLLY